MRLKNEKGSITIFVLVALLFMSAFLMIAYANNVNKSKIAKEQLDIMRYIYYKENDSQSYEDAYYNFMKENKDLVTATVENEHSIEITNASKAQRCNNYRIWGNSIPDITNPIEYKYVGNSGNLLDINNPKYTAYNTHSLGYEGKIENGVLYNAGLYGSSDGSCMYIEKPEGVKYLTLSFVAGEEAPENGTDGYRCRFYYFNGIDENTGLATDLYRGSSIHYIEGYNSYTTIDCSSYKYIGFTIIGLSKYEVSFRNVQLEVGKYATDYASYGMYKIPIGVKRSNYIYEEEYTKSSGTIIKEYPTYYEVTTQVNTNGIIWEIESDNLKVGDKLDFQAKVMFVSSAEEEANDSVTLRIRNLTKEVWIDAGKNGKETVCSTITTGAENVLKLTGVELTSDKYSEGDLIGFFVSRGIGKQEFNKNEIVFRVYKDSVIIQKSGENQESNVFSSEKYYINLSKPLALGDYVDFVSGKVKRLDGTVESVNVPEISIFEDYTKIEVLTEVVPSKIEVEYEGYKLD